MPPPPRLTPDQVRYGHAGRAFKAQDSWRFDVCVALQGAKLPGFFHRSFFPLFLDLSVALALSTTVLEVTDSEGGKIIKRRGKNKIKKMNYGHGTNSSPRGPMDKAPAYGAGDCRFNPGRGYFKVPYPTIFSSPILIYKSCF
jgi:hypothetical protein